MRLSLRLVVPLTITLAVSAFVIAPLADRITLRWSVRDMDMRADLIANAIGESLLEQINSTSKDKLPRFFARITRDERLYALGYCATPKSTVIASRLFPSDLRCSELSEMVTTEDHLLKGKSGMLHVAVKPLLEQDETTGAAGRNMGALILVHDMGFVKRRGEEAQRYILYFFAGLAVFVSLMMAVIAEFSWRGWIRGMRDLLRGEGPHSKPGGHADIPEYRPIARDLEQLIKDLESEVRGREDGQAKWTPESLRAVLKGELRSDDVIIVSNREPYIHERKEDKIDVRRPASGLVTALEPIMRACSGTWIAHGGGSADKETVDGHDHVQVPPEHPEYQIRRVWLTKEEEAGYYYGFANEGMWPLCHIAHVRPVFRSSDWEAYEAVNRKFALAVKEEAKTAAPVVLVQDYHFALLPRMIRELLPDATVITFWHIPWPNPESFSICPWREQIVQGLLGSSILGFHTQSHCNNFVDTVDRLVEARVDRETLRVSFGGHMTAVRRYPISIDWPPPAHMLEKPLEACRAEIRQLNGMPDNHLIGVGVDRLDYTKGIIERMHAIERLLVLKPEWVGKFSFVQIAAPTRSSIGEYHAHEVQVRELAAEINERFASAVPPIILKVEHHEAEEVYEYYRAAELCFVSSLHDGMNLVAKEFVAARDDEHGVLVLSQFTGAARELPEALIVNPYDADQCAAALHLALTMPKDEQAARMRLMRTSISQFNVYRWAARMLLDAAIMRQRERIPDGPANAGMTGGN